MPQRYRSNARLSIRGVGAFPPGSLLPEGALDGASLALLIERGHVLAEEAPPKASSARKKGRGKGKPQKVRKKPQGTPDGEG